MEGPPSRKWNGIKSLFRGGNRSTVDTTSTTSIREEEHPLKKSLSTGSISGLLLKIKIVDSFQAKSNDKKFVVCVSWRLVLNEKIYVLEVNNIKLRTDWKVHRRYNQFKELNRRVIWVQSLTNQLVDKFGELKAVFPPGKAIGRFAKDFIEKRSKMLQVREFK